MTSLNVSWLGTPFGMSKKVSNQFFFERVAIQVEKGNMAVMRSEIEQVQDKTLPVLFCNEIIYQPEITDKILEVVKKLEPFYSE